MDFYTDTHYEWMVYKCKCVCVIVLCFIIGSAKLIFIEYFVFLGVYVFLFVYVFMCLPD